MEGKEREKIKEGKSGGERKNGGEGEKNGVEGEENGVEGEEHGKTRDEREKEQEIEAEGGEQEDDDDEENNDEAQQEKNDTHNNEKAKSSVQRKETIDNMRVRGKKAIFPTEQSTARVSKRGSKRKSKVQEVVDDRSKRSKTRASTPTTDIASLKCLEHIPRSSIQPAEVYKIFLDRSQSEDQNGIWFMTRLFFAIASPDAFYQLRDTCTSIREDDASTILQPTNSIAQTIQALDSLEIAASTNSILRRYHLIRLVDHRNERETHYKKGRPERAVRNIKEGSEGYGRASSLALADLMAQAYPKLKPLQEPRKNGGRVPKETEVSQKQN